MIVGGGSSNPSILDPTKPSIGVGVRRSSWDARNRHTKLSSEAPLGGPRGIVISGCTDAHEQEQQQSSIVMLKATTRINLRKKHVHACPQAGWWAEHIGHSSLGT